MRMKAITAALVAVLLVTMLPMGVFTAENADVTCVLDAENKTLTVDIAAGVLVPNSKADLVIMNPSKTLADVKESNSIFFADHLQSDKYGRVQQYVVDMADASLGIYAVYIIPSDGGASIAKTVTYLQGSFESSFLERINGTEGATADAMKVLMNGEDAKTFMKNQVNGTLTDDTILYEYMVSMRSYEALHQIQTAYNVGCVLALFSEGNGTKRQSVLADYGVMYLAIDQNAEMYTMYQNSTRKETICESVSANLKTPEMIRKGLYDATVLTTVRLSSWNEMQAVFEEAKSYLSGIDYDKVQKNLTKVSKATAGKDYATIADFETAICNAYSEDAGSSGDDSHLGGHTGSFGGFGGGGSVGGGGIEVGDTTEKYEPENQLFVDWDSIPSYAKSYLESLYENGIFVGDPDGNFRPDDAILRQEICKILVEGFQVEPANGEIAFADVSNEAWYAEYIKTAFAAGYIKGKSEILFGVNETLTREDFAVILERMLHDGTKVEETMVYHDTDLIADYAKDAVNFVTSKGIMQGYDGAFDPKGSVTRAQAAKVMGKLLYENLEGDAE